MSTNTPPKSIRSRMGTAMRRTSSVLSLGGSRPTTPGVASPKPSQIPTSRARSSSVATSASDTSSVSRPSIDTSVPIVPTPSAVKPSPIAESPSREAAATAEDIREELREPLRPTPLAQVVTASTEPETPVETRESEKTQPAIIGSANGPNTFTEEPEEMSLRGARSNESLQSNPAALTTNASGEPPAPASDTASEDAPNAPVKAAEPSYFELPANPPPEPLSDSASLHHAIIENTIGAPADDVSDRTSSDQDQTTPRPHGPADTENANVFYAFSEIPTPTPVPDIQEDKPTSEPIAILKETEQEIPTPAPAPDIQGQPSSEPISIPKETKRGDVDVIEREVSNSARLAEPSQNKPEEDIVEVPTAGPTVEPIPILLNPKQDDISLVQMPTPEIPGSKQPLPENVPQKPREENVATLPGIIPYDVGLAQEAWASQSDNKDALGRELANSSVQTLQDPFADPVPSIHVSTIAPSMMPEPDITTAQASAPQSAPKVVVFPVPEREVVISRPINEIPSLEQHFHHETDENQPLLGSQITPQTSYLHANSSQPMTAHLNVSGLPSSSSSVAWPQVKPPPSHSSTPRLNHLGWIEYALPDTTVYYSHPTLRVITDVDLRSITKLDAVTAYLEHRRLHDGSGTPPGFELWLRQNDSTGSGAAHGKSTKKKRALGKMKEFVPVRYWVDHRKRIVTSDPIWDAQGDGSGRRHQTGKVSEDSLDMEYRYWAFMEDHPAHVSLPHNARNDAVDVLTWSWTDRLLPSQRDALPPFTQAECQELNNLLRSFGEPTAESGIQSVLQTRVVSRILMRVVQWRQTNFRPHKPLPQDIGIRPSPTKQRQSTFQRTFLDIMVAVIFLGVPYLFLPRINSSSLYHLDEESGLFNSRSAAPVILLGGCTCLVAAIVLSASVTFLSLPGLDVSRIAGLVAALLATFSMVSTLVAFFRYKSDMDCVASWVGDRVGGEGMMLHSKRVVVLSLPLALLVYSIISFVVGIVLYSFFGVSETPTNVLQRHFEEYTRWTVVGVLGGLTGILFTSLLLLRR